MRSRKERLDHLREAVQDATRTLSQIPRASWASPGDRARVTQVFSYLAMVLELTDAALMSDSTFDRVETLVNGVVSQPDAVTGNVAGVADSLLDAVAALPVARGRGMEQAAKNAATKFQNSAAQRLGTLEREIGRAKHDAATLSQEIAGRSEEFANKLAQQSTAFAQELEERSTKITSEIGRLSDAVDAKLAEADRTIEEDRTRSKQLRDELEELKEKQRLLFDEAEQRRETAAREQLDVFAGGLADLRNDVEQELDTQVSEIKRMAGESAQLVGAIGLGATAERFGEEVVEQKQVADLWRRVTVAAVGFAVLVALWATIRAAPTAEDLAAKLGVSLLLGGVATYAARQSASHRRREEEARRLQLELTAFAPFIEPLAPEHREAARLLMAERTFGKTASGVVDGDETGPTVWTMAQELGRRPSGVGTERNGSGMSGE